MTMEWPQAAMIIWCVIEISVYIGKRGEPVEYQVYKPIAKIFDWGLVMWILNCGGFFNGL